MLCVKYGLVDLTPWNTLHMWTQIARELDEDRLLFKESILVIAIVYLKLEIISLLNVFLSFSSINQLNKSAQ